MPDETYTYDHVGNRQTAAGISGNWSYNANNELLSFADVEYTYDNNGNLTQKKVGTAAVNYMYNPENRLVKVEDDLTKVVMAEYGYDPFGRRLWKDVQGVRTYFFYSEEGLIAEYDANGNEIRSYGYQPDSTWGTAPLWLKENGHYYFYQNDHLGTPMKLVAVNGAVVWSASYAAFGNAHVEVETVVNNLRFPGQYYDVETGLHYNWFRYYEPGTGRYLQKDPIKFLGADVNLYSYGGNNPTNKRDILGLSDAATMTMEPVITIPGLGTVLAAIGEALLVALESPAVALTGAYILGYTAGTYINETWVEPRLWNDSRVEPVPPIAIPMDRAIPMEIERERECCTDNAGQTCPCDQLKKITYYVILPGKDPNMRFGHAFLELPGGIGIGWTVKDTSPLNMARVFRGKVVDGILSPDTMLRHHKDKLPLRTYAACPGSVAAVAESIIINSSGKNDKYHLYNQQARNCYGWAAKVLFDVGFLPPIYPYQSFVEFQGTKTDPFERFPELIAYLLSLAQ